MTKRLNSFLDALIFLCFLFISLILALSKSLSNAVLDAIMLWAGCVLPALFPYLFISAIFSQLKTTKKLSAFITPLTKRCFNTGGAVGYAFLLSLISGYPMGAKAVCDLKLSGAISEIESERASAFCSTSSPTFLIGSVGNLMFSSPFFGVLLFICHLFSAFLVGFIFSFYKKKSEKNNLPISFLSKNIMSEQTEKSANFLYDGVYNSIISVLVVGGIIVLFYLLTEILLLFKIISPLSYALSFVFQSEKTAESFLLGLFECTRGLKSLSTLGLTPLSLPISALITGFGGLSVIVQSVAFLKRAKIKTAPFIFAKLLSAVLNFIFGLIFTAIFL